MCVLFRKLSGGHCQLGWRTEDKTPLNKYQRYSIKVGLGKVIKTIMS